MNREFFKSIVAIVALAGGAQATAACSETANESAVHRSSTQISVEANRTDAAPKALVDTARTDAEERNRAVVRYARGF